MTRNEIREFFMERQAAWNDRDPERLAAGHAEFGVVVSPMFTTVKGRAQILATYRSLFRMFPDWDYEGEDPLVDGDRIAQPFSVKATHTEEFLGFPGSGRRFEIQGVRVFRMKDGLIEHERRIYDFTGLLVQIGVLKTKPAKT
jgi:steroid delta-isomerase-like uncharacterized protein